MKKARVCLDLSPIVPRSICRVNKRKVVMKSLRFKWLLIFGCNLGKKMTFSDDGVLLTKFDRMYDNVRPGNEIHFNTNLTQRYLSINLFSYIAFHRLCTLISRLYSK